MDPILEYNEKLNFIKGLINYCDYLSCKVECITFCGHFWVLSIEQIVEKVNSSYWIIHRKGKQLKVAILLKK